MFSADFGGNEPARAFFCLFSAFSCSARPAFVRLAVLLQVVIAVADLSLSPSESVNVDQAAVYAVILSSGGLWWAFSESVRYSTVRGSGAFRAIFGGSGVVWVKLLGCGCC